MPGQKGAPLSDATIGIDRSQRQPLQGLLLQRFTGITDPGPMIKRGDHGLAERLGNELAADVRLLNDLGWDPDDRREIFAITVPVGTSSPRCGGSALTPNAA